MFSITATVSDGLISINGTLFVQVINILILIFILNKIMFKPIRAIVSARTRKFKDGQAEIEKISEDSVNTEAVYVGDRQKGRIVVRDGLSDLKHHTEEDVNKILANAQEKGKQHQVAVLASIDDELIKARVDIKAEAEKVAAGMANSILGREIS